MLRNILRYSLFGRSTSLLVIDIVLVLMGTAWGSFGFLQREHALRVANDLSTVQSDLMPSNWFRSSEEISTGSWPDLDYLFLRGQAQSWKRYYDIVGEENYAYTQLIYHQNFSGAQNGLLDALKYRRGSQGRTDYSETPLKIPNLNANESYVWCERYSYSYEKLVDWYFVTRFLHVEGCELIARYQNIQASLLIARTDKLDHDEFVRIARQFDQRMITYLAQNQQ